MGPYCNFCGHRCFVHRVMPADSTWRPGEPVILATCPAGKAASRDLSGYDADTAINPADPPAPATEAPIDADVVMCWARAHAWRKVGAGLLQAAVVIGGLGVLLGTHMLTVSLSQDGAAPRRLSPPMPSLLAAAVAVVLFTVAGIACIVRATRNEREGGLR